MLQFELSKHASEQIEIRGIPRGIVFDVVQNPDKIEVDGQGQYIYQKQVYLKRVLTTWSVFLLIQTKYLT